MGHALAGFIHTSPDSSWGFGDDVSFPPGKPPFLPRLCQSPMLNSGSRQLPRSFQNSRVWMVCISRFWSLDETLAHSSSERHQD